ncbi:unnamed protein product [Pieris brassicae]|uniref:Uncharacterized protein n=1 Tax=Pieris brassicae TaxID=7116 RepID=A0A9P0TQV3_PIEBR|nr:unnamed protein product [Pieris brassicae]
MCQRSAGEQRCRKRNKSGAEQKAPECSGQVDAAAQSDADLGGWPLAARQRHRTSQSAPGLQPCRLSFFPYRNAAMCRFRFIFYGRVLQRRAIALLF